MFPIRAMNRCEATPFDALARWSRDLDRFFNDVLPAGGSLPMDVHQEGEHLVIEAEVPGLKKEDVEITVENGVLTISAGREGQVEDRQEGYYVRERRSGKVTRSFTLPNTYDVESVEANLTDGLLTLRIPTREEATPRLIAGK